jgi:biopolymer transport protein TolR
MKSFQRRRTRRASSPEITLTPMIDTFCVLLVIFIVAAPMVQNGIRIDLPFGKTREVGPSQELVVTINKQQHLFFNSYPIERKNLVSTVQKALNQKEDTPVYVRADEAIAYGKVIEIVDELKQAGVRFVAMSTRPS